MERKMAGGESRDLIIQTVYIKIMTGKRGGMKMRKKLVTFALCIVTTFAATTTVFATESAGEAGPSEGEGAEEAESEPSGEE